MRLEKVYGTDRKSNVIIAARAAALINNSRRESLYLEE